MNDLLPQDLAMKIAFAKLLLKYDDAFKAALELVPDNTNVAIQMAMKWPVDKEVVAAKVELLGDDETDGLGFLPTKADYARKVWETANDDLAPPEERTKLYKLYGEIRGFLEKPMPKVEVNDNRQNNIMVIRESANDDEWEVELAKQQEALTDVSGG